MNLSRLWVFLAVALPVLATLIGHVATVDLTYLIRAGDEILGTGRIPSMDTWTFTAAGLPWVDQQWGAQVLFAAVFRLGGWTGLVLMRAVLVAIIFGCVYAICRRRGLPVRTAALLTLLSFVIAAIALGLRAQAIGMTFFAVLLLLVTERRAHPRLLWAVPPLVLVWANLHGSFFLAPLILGLAWLEDIHDRVAHPHRTLVVAVVSVLAACVTPFGPSVWLYAAGLTTNSAVTNDIAEWQPTSIRTMPGLLFFGSVFGVALVIARRGRATPWPTLAWLAVFFLIGVYAARGIAWWPLAAVVAVAGLLAPPVPEPEQPEPATRPILRRLNAAIVVLFIVVGIALLPVWRPVDPRLGAPEGMLLYAPPGITAKLRELARPGDRLFNPQEWGSWFEFTLPDLPVAMDSRIEFYPAQIWRDYSSVLAGSNGWEGHIASWDPTIAVIAKRDQAIVDRFAGLGWRSIYSDEDGSMMLAPIR
ncbi:MAG: hypothetical protein ABJC39_07355 [Chloroflexota bacterium]